MSKKYTLSLGKKANLRADLESWRGKTFTAQELSGFDIGSLLGVPCMITIKQEKKGEKTYSNVASVTRFPAALKASKPTPINEQQLFDVTEPDMRVYEVLPDWIKGQIDQCVERSAKKPESTASAGSAAGQAAARQATSFDDMEDEIPF